MKLQWIRLYIEVLDDPKVQTLLDKIFKFWINCLCLAGKNSGTLPQADQIAFSLRLKLPTVKNYLEQLHKVGLLDSIDGTYVPHAWAARQYKSDNSTERVKRFREGKMKRSRNVSCNVSETVSVTAPDTDTDTERETLPPTPLSVVQDPDLSDIARSICFRHPKHRRPTLQAVERCLAQICIDTPDPEATAAGIDDRHAGWCASHEWTRDAQRYVPNLLRWLDPNHGGWMTDPPEAASSPGDDIDEVIRLSRLLESPGGLQ